MKKVLDVLYFLRLVDDQRRLSLTNIFVMISTYALLRECGTTETASFVASMISYQAKRWMQPEVGADGEAEVLKAAVKSMETKLAALAATGRLPKQ